MDGHKAAIVRHNSSGGQLMDTPPRTGTHAHSSERSRTYRHATRTQVAHTGCWPQVIAAVEGAGKGRALGANRGQVKQRSDQRRGLARQLLAFFVLKKFWYSRPSFWCPSTTLRTRARTRR